MPTVDQTYVFDGSRLERNYQDARRSRAIVICSVSGLDDTTEAKTQAINAAVAAVGTTYTDGSLDIPLLSTNADIWATGQAWVTLNYGFSYASNPTLDPWSLAPIRYFGEDRDPMFTRIYRDASGELQSEDITQPGIYEYLSAMTDGFDEVPTPPDKAISINRQDRRRVPVFQIDVPAGALDFNPLAVMADLVRHHNSDTVTIAGHDFGPGQLRCVGWQGNAVDQQGEVRRPSHYAFLYKPTGFFRRSLEVKQVYVGPPSPTSGLRDIGIQYILTIEPASPSASFADGFPTFNGVGPPAA